MGQHSLLPKSHSQIKKPLYNHMPQGSRMDSSPLGPLSTEKGRVFVRGHTYEAASVLCSPAGQDSKMVSKIPILSHIFRQALIQVFEGTVFEACCGGILQTSLRSKIN